MYPSRRLRESWLIVGVESADDRLMRNGSGDQRQSLRSQSKRYHHEPARSGSSANAGHATGACVIGEGCRQGYPIA